MIVNVSNVALGPSLGDTALFSCNSNLTLCGNETLTCEANGNWSAPDPLCRRKYNQNRDYIALAIFFNVLVFCIVQEVYVGDRVFNVCIEYTRARELKPLIAEPSQLSIGALGSVVRDSEKLIKIIISKYFLGMEASQGHFISIET